MNQTQDRGYSNLIKYLQESNLSFSDMLKEIRKNFKLGIPADAPINYSVIKLVTTGLADYLNFNYKDMNELISGAASFEYHRVKQIERIETALMNRDFNLAAGLIMESDI
jgi:hypothetical protein